MAFLASEEAARAVRSDAVEREQRIRRSRERRKRRSAILSSRRAANRVQNGHYGLGGKRARSNWFLAELDALDLPDFWKRRIDEDNRQHAPQYQNRFPVTVNFI